MPIFRVSKVLPSQQPGTHIQTALPQRPQSATITTTSNTYTNCLATETTIHTATGYTSSKYSI